MSWVLIMIICGLAISAALNGIIHLIFRLTGGRFDDGDTPEEQGR